MEYGIRLSRPVLPLDDPRQWCPKKWRDLLPDGPLTAVYFGSEFCQDLLPAAKEAEAFCVLATEAGLEAVLLTPPVRTDGLHRIQTLVSALTTRGYAPTIVFNDFGVLHLLRSAHPASKRQAGRLLNRALRDPRLVEESPAAQRPETARGGQLRTLLQRYGVAGLETDPDLTGGYLGEQMSGLQRVLHLPYTFVASGRNCLFKAESNNDQMNFATGLTNSCSASCRDRWQQEERQDLAFPLWRAGNTLFYEAHQAAVEAHLDQVDRIVVHERPLA
ncbi:hypothetical protein [Geopsychrobacter electrodiphilus]|uniref:hypothetical protein n=1 Tax=Geopsychrobacter electrodiphilus TaxID=225196 RepID=UPI0003651537|nr:hypothetical protein [Geopsychrobacter electrodiphilus]